MWLLHIESKFRHKKAVRKPGAMFANFGSKMGLNKHFPFSANAV